MALHVGNVELEGCESPVAALLQRLVIAPEELVAWQVVRKSLDARHGRQLWRGVCRIEVANEDEVVARAGASVRRWTERDDGRYGLTDGAPGAHTWPPGHHVVVVGAGPAGLFSSLYLAEAGAKVTLIERGGDVDERVAAVNGHWRRRLPLDPENNILFGEGGAGTFSDGKIYTRRRDGDVGYVMRRFVDFGADPEVLREAYAHLGTDRVRAILPRHRARLRELGVDVRFHARVDGLLVKDGRCVGVRLADGEEVPATAVFVAAGHSARDTIGMLVRSGASARASETAIGARVEHPQSVIDAGRYGVAHSEELPPASYRLTFAPETGRSAHTFCMCPGGVVVPASNMEGRCVVNGMSFASRRAYWANSAVIVEVHPDDYPEPGPLGGYAWQDVIERACFEAGGGDGAAPAQRVPDFLAHRASEHVPKTSFPLGVRAANLWGLLPEFVCQGMADALVAFDKQLPGFISDEAVLIAPETRTTSPVRFDRSEGGESATLPGLYPLGEGAGYGGGIISCALDGLRAAKAVTARDGVRAGQACG